MKPTGESHSFVLPPALLAEVEAAANEEHWPVDEVVREVLQRYLAERKGASATSEILPVRGRDRVVLRVGDLSDADLAAIAASEMDSRHNYLDDGLK